MGTRNPRDFCFSDVTSTIQTKGAPNIALSDFIAQKTVK
jgi:hypothetical protein